MKIGFAIGVLNFSGAEKIARYLIESLHKAGHEVGVLLLGRTDNDPDFDYIKQFPMYIDKKNTVLRVLERHKQIKKAVKQEKFDVLISFGSIYNIDIMESLRNSKTPVILCERNDPRNDTHRKVLRIRRRLIYKKAAGFVFQTQNIADFFGEKISSRSVVIPNFLEKRYERVDCEKADNNIVITARLAEVQKNISMLLRAFNRFSKGNDYKLYIVGDGPDQEMYENYIKENGLEDRVVMPGKQNVLPYLQNAKFYVLSSYYEGMPNSLMEAMAVGLPCISTDFSGGGARALINNMENGIIVPSNDEDAMVEAMTKLAGDATLRQMLAEEAYKINDTLEFNKIIAMWMEYIEKIAKENKR